MKGQLIAAQEAEQLLQQHITELENQLSQNVQGKAEVDALEATLAAVKEELISARQGSELQGTRLAEALEGEEKLRKEVDTLRFAKKQAELFSRDKERAEEPARQLKMD